MKYLVGERVTGGKLKRKETRDHQKPIGITNQERRERHTKAKEEKIAEKAAEETTTTTDSEMLRKMLRHKEM